MPRKTTTNIAKEESVSAPVVEADFSNKSSKVNENRVSSQEPLTDGTEHIS